MITWIRLPVPEEREVAHVAMVDGQPFAAIARWRRHWWERAHFMVVFERSRREPILFRELAGAKHYVQAAIAAAAVAR